MKRILQTLVVLICSASIVSCSNMSKQDIGTLTGGVAGGVLGSTVGQGQGRILAIGVGTLAGAFIGNAIGKNMDDTDKLKVQSALNNNNVGEPAYWKNAQSGNSYKVVPVKNVTVNGNKYCREYRTVADIGGKKQEMYGTACRQPDGSWKAN
jgi:surface antigen